MVIVSTKPALFSDPKFDKKMMQWWLGTGILFFALILH
jgi:hypothetical protein